MTEAHFMAKRIAFGPIMGGAVGLIGGWLMDKSVRRGCMEPVLPHHIVAGGRGKGDAPDSSGGVVPYRSSHMETADSEKIILSLFVPSY